MNINIVLSEEDLKKLVVKELSDKLNCNIDIGVVKIEVKSKQNYKSEWEPAAFRATIIQDTSVG